MLLQNPFIATEKKYFAEYIQLWNNFIAEYNLDADGESKPLSKQLRGPHMQTYFQLVHIARKSVNRDNRYLSKTGLNVINPQEAYSIRTTRGNLSRALGMSTDTAHRYLTRLEQAGVVTRKGHGTRSPFELFINPDFLLIYDYQQENYLPGSKYFRSENCENQTPLHANCTHIPLCTKEHSNNIIMPVDNSTDKNLSCVLSDLQNEHHRGSLPAPIVLNNERNIRKQLKPIEKSKPICEGLPPVSAELEQKKEKSCAKKEKAEVDLQRLRKSFAARLYAIMIDLLFKNHSIYEAEKDNAILYIERYYMSQITSKRQAEQTLNQYRWRTEMAASYIRRRNYNFSNIYPCAYLDINNKTGFSATKKWAKVSENEARRKRIARVANHKKLIDTDKLDKIIEQFNERPNLGTYKTCQTYVKKNIPHLFQEFIAATNISIDPKTTTYN